MAATVTLVRTLVLLLAVCGALSVRHNGRFGGRRRKAGGKHGQVKAISQGKSERNETFSMKEYVHQHRKQSVYCFQCAYSPDKDVYETVTAPSVVKDSDGRTRLAYRTRLMKVRRQGGWDKCVGPFNNSEANDFGIDVKECDNTCYARLEKSGNIFRGCYRGAYDVDPYKYGCHVQQGSIWCFCKGHVCNNNEIVHKNGNN